MQVGRGIMGQGVVCDVVGQGQFYAEITILTSHPRIAHVQRYPMPCWV